MFLFSPAVTLQGVTAICFKIPVTVTSALGQIDGAGRDVGDVEKNQEGIVTMRSLAKNMGD